MILKVIHKVEAESTLKMFDIAQALADSDSKTQAAFFNEFFKILKSDTANDFSFDKELLWLAEDLDYLSRNSLELIIKHVEAIERSNKNENKVLHKEVNNEKKEILINYIFDYVKATDKYKQWHDDAQVCYSKLMDFINQQL